MTAPSIHWIVPGALEQRTGGYLYDARIVGGLRGLGWTVHIHGLAGVFPDPDPEAAEAMRLALESIPDGERVVLDGLAMGGLPGPIADEASRLQLIALVHHPLAYETGLREEDRDRLLEAERAALAHCAQVVVTSEFTARMLADLDVPPERIAVVRPGTDRAPIACGPAAGHVPALLCVATVTPRKGHDVLVRALERVRDLPWRCVCVGALDRAPRFTQAVRQHIHDAGLDDRIDLLGEQSGTRLDALYHGASVLVLASHFEGYGMAFAEALVRGLPIVGTSGGAIPETVPPDAAVLVPPGDVTAFADALRTVLTDEAKREDLAAAARRHGTTLPNWDEATRAFAAALEDLAS